MLWAYGSAPRPAHLPVPPTALLTTSVGRNSNHGTERHSSPCSCCGNGTELLLKETGIRELAAMPELPGSFISSSNFRQEAELCQGCPRREEAVIAHTIRSFPDRVCCLPQRSAVGWSTRGAHGHTQTWHVPLSHHRQEQPSHSGARLITGGTAQENQALE